MKKLQICVQISSQLTSFERNSDTFLGEYYSWLSEVPFPMYGNSFAQGKTEKGVQNRHDAQKEIPTGWLEDVWHHRPRWVNQKLYWPIIVDSIIRTRRITFSARKSLPLLFCRRDQLFHDIHCTTYVSKVKNKIWDSE